ncbi:MAG: GrpB family protein [Pseudomonadota bacterium]
MNIVVPHDPSWKRQYLIEADLIRRELGNSILALHHIGSTAISGILAKPIIDILGVSDCLDRLDHQVSAFERMGYESLGEYGVEGRRYFRKCDSSGKRTHHLHCFASGSPHITRHLAFRDFLRSHPVRADAYSTLKRVLVEEQKTDWEAYISGKAQFVEETENLALNWFNRLNKPAG